MTTSETETIAAPATAPQSAIGIVRLSGPDAVAIAQRCFLGWPDAPTSHRLYHGRVVDPDSGEILDEALCVLMRGPNSFTGEDVVEIQGHGGALNLGRIVDAALRAGARLAQPGEFSLRAFRNGRVDLTQAEAIAEIVAAESAGALRAAQAQLGGSLKVPIAQLRADLLDLLTLLEASLDFAAEEHVYQVPYVECLGRVEAASEALGAMLGAWREGRRAVLGARVVLAGAPNVGKSSLFNRLLGLDRAIVTEVAGTTRDLLRDATRIGGHRIELVDTAGLRDTADRVEAIGVSRTRDEAERADVVVWVVAAGESLAGLDASVRAAAAAGRSIVVVNKVDLLDARTAAGPLASAARTRGHGGRQRAAVAQDVASALRDAGLLEVPVVTASAASGEGIVRVERELAEAMARGQGTEGGVPLLTSERHARAIEDAVEALGRAHSALDGELPLEMAATDVRDATDALGEIIGAIATDEVLGRIFSSFCVGK